MSRAWTAGSAAFAFALSACGAGGAKGATGGAGVDAAPAPEAAGSPAPVTALVGELHLHQFPDGSHAWAAFIDPPLPMDALKGDSVTELDTAITKVEGPCTLYVTPTCTPDCAASAFCQAPNQCVPLPTWTYIDAGPIDVTGSSVVPQIRLFWDGPGDVYQADPPPGAGVLFAGGEDLRIVGGTGDYAFQGELPAPTRVVVRAPDLSQLQLPTSGPLDVVWVSEQTDEVEILVSASSSSGSANIRCVTGDTGALTVPADFVEALPPPPRATRFEILRVEQRFLPIARAGQGLLVHAAQSTWANGMN